MKAVSHLAVLIMLIVITAFTDNAYSQTNPKKGVSEAPSDSKALAARYYRGDGTGYNVSITLAADGSYSSEWHGCLGKYGEASGTWTLAGRKLTFAPTKEDGMMKGHLKELEVMRFDAAWILVPTKKQDREFYEKWGISRYSCFQKADTTK